MKFLLNAIQLRVAGGRSVGLNLLGALRELSHEHSLVAYVPAQPEYQALAGPRLRVECVPPHLHRAGLRSWVDHVWWRGRVARERPDAVFSMGNVALPLRAPQLLLFHWPYAIYPEDEVRRRLRLFRRRLRYATVVAAQTATARARLERLYGLGNVETLPNAVSLPPESAAPAEPPLPEALRQRGLLRLLCLSRYYPHKNLEVLLPLAERIRERGLPYRVLLTVAPDEHPAAAALLGALRAARLEDVVHNLGPVPMTRIPALYQACDGLLLPTLMESFSGTYIEAMHYGRPVFTSDRDFAHDVCGDDAFFFDPHSPDDILRTLEKAFADPEALRARVEDARRRSRSFPSWHELAERCLALLEEVARRGAREPA
jgi:glycosyltransferase involved in cell wall biosynthesis